MLRIRRKFAMEFSELKTWGQLIVYYNNISFSSKFQILYIHASYNITLFNIIPCTFLEVYLNINKVTNNSGYLFMTAL